MNKTPLTLSDEDEPVIIAFLAFLEKDITMRAKTLPTFSAELLNRANALVANMNVDLNAPLSENDG